MVWNGMQMQGHKRVTCNVCSYSDDTKIELSPTDEKQTNEQKQKKNKKKNTNEYKQIVL